MTEQDDTAGSSSTTRALPAQRRRVSHRSILGLWSVRGAGLGIGLLIVAIVALTAQAAMNVLVLVFVSILLA
jgi:hypothetical protein